MPTCRCTDLRLALYQCFAGLAGSAALAALRAVSRGARAAAAARSTCRSVGQALVGGPFTLTDHTGKRVTDKDFRGKFMLVFFGFTICPDVCPTALQVMAAALDKLGPKAERIVPMFITSIPSATRPAQLASMWRASIRASSASPARRRRSRRWPRPIASTSRRCPTPSRRAGYTIDHSSLIYLMGPDGAYRDALHACDDVDAMADRLAGMLQKLQSEETCARVRIYLRDVLQTRSRAFTK